MPSPILFVKPLYLEKMDLLEQNAVITAMGIDEINKKIYQWIQLDVTIFHPKGGGQPSDEGFIQGMPVTYVHKNIPNKENPHQFEILHCFEENRRLDYTLGQKVNLKVNPTSRQLHSRLHTAGHLVAEAVNVHFPFLEIYQWNHLPKSSYIKFKAPTLSLEIESIKNKSQEQLHTWIEANLPVQDHQDPIRTIQISKDKVACEGTHVKALGELKAVIISDISMNKDKILTIKYTL